MLLRRGDIAIQSGTQLTFKNSVSRLPQNKQEAEIVPNTPPHAVGFMRRKREKAGLLHGAASSLHNPDFVDEIPAYVWTQVY